MKKVLLIANSKFTITNFRKELLDDLAQRGYEFKIVAPIGRDLDGRQVTADDVLPIRLDRKGIKLRSDLILIFDLYKIIKAEKPDIILNYTIKPVIYGSIVAGILSAGRIFSNITGLGYVFTDGSRKANFLKKLVVFLYRIALSYNDKVFFQNPDDVKLFIDYKILQSDRVKILNGSGINTQRFSVNENIPKRPQSFLFVGRLLKDKGLAELIEAFGEVRRYFPEAILTIAGDTDENPNSFKKVQIEKWKSDAANVFFLGRVDDVLSLLQSHQVMVLPSYREGTPRSVLEAMAVGLPIITTDAPGCRETVIDWKTGFLVPVKDRAILAERMMYFLRNPEKIKEMGGGSLELARSKFDVRSVNKDILTTIGAG